MIASFLNSDLIKSNFDVSFAYNYNEEYERGLNNRVFSSGFSKYPLKLRKPHVYNRLSGSPFVIRWVQNAFWVICFIFCKYWSIGVNTILLYRFYKNKNIDILHINNGGYPAEYSCYSAVIAGRIMGIKKIIYIVNNIAADYKRPNRWLDYPIDFFIKKWVTVFITGSENAGERLKKVLNLDKKKHLIINNGIKKRAITVTKEEFKIKYSIPENKLIASVGANLEKRKGHIFLLEAILQIKKQYPKNLIPFFIFAGDGPEKKILEEYIFENELAEYVLMIDYIPDIFNLLNASDFVILPSIANEDFPFIVIEAMSLGKPAIGTDIAGMPEQIENNKTGIIVKPKNSDELLQAIMLLAINPLLLQQYSILAKIRFDTLFEESISVRKYYDLYKSI
jgi:glycosyltransferase involved in cell wall biosynthesis